MGARTGNFSNPMLPIQVAWDPMIEQRADFHMCPLNQMHSSNSLFVVGLIPGFQKQRNVTSQYRSKVKPFVQSIMDEFPINGNLRRN